MKKIQKIMTLLLFLSIIVYPLKKHTDTVMALFHSVLRVVTEPLKISRYIFDSKDLQGFPGESLKLSDSFHEKLPDQKEFFFSEPLTKDALFYQRMVEYNFPMLFNKTAKCGFVEESDQSFGAAFKTIDVVGGYKIVCNP